MSPEAEHGIQSAHWNNFGDGWQILCLCGWESGCNRLMEPTGEEFDVHLNEQPKAAEAV